MADLGIEGWFGYDDARAFDVVVDEAGVESRAVVDVIEAVREVGGDLQAREPCGQDGVARVVWVAEALGEAGSGDELVDEVDVAPGEGRAEELDEAAVVAPRDEGEAVLELREVDRAAGLALENDGVFAADGAAPRGGGGGGGDAVGEEIVGGG